MCINLEKNNSEMIYLHLETVDGRHVLVDQDGRKVAAVRNLDIALAYDDVSEYCLRGLLHHPENKTSKHVNR